MKIEVKDGNVNHGVLLGQKPNDWIAGKVGNIQYEVRNPSGGWLPYLTVFEKQWFPKFDTMACVSFSALTLCEIQIKHQTGQEVNFADRFLAKQSGTTTQGNWLYIVGDTLRNIGCVLEAEWPVPQGDITWNDYYAPIPQFVIDRARPQFLDKYEIQTEWIEYTNNTELKVQLEKHLKHAPLQIVIPGHAVAGILVSVEGNTATYFDTYEGNSGGIKTTPLSNIVNVYKILLTVKNMAPEFIHITGTPQYGLLYTNEFVKTVVLFTSEADAKDKLKVQNIDWSKARDISL